ncbi:MAG: hypothetical protein G3M70_11315 [Candidatus Nitronauta litoralis]|uniref:Uncharacterized protein n=1 Tax=Candidatus Nitronauta litoralis TaxID=2705533 RepID=A0A7T0BX20_9BACT|nr:MAG: hypothetical protein G3M70_11315 [Candidatus Nitronauta litoralis]
MKTGFQLKTSTRKGLLGILAILLLAVPSSAFTGEVIKVSQVETTSDARRAVEKAWEVYHHAALGGTLASPTVQSQMEAKLHKSRALLAEAYEAEERGEQQTTETLIRRIMKITNTVIAGSQEPKK